MEAPLIIFDRDGVINHDSHDYIRTVDQLRLIDGAVDSIAKLYHLGCRVVVATNQSGIGRGYFTHETLEDMFKKIQIELQKKGAAIYHYYYCPHLPIQHCSCRKPASGMIQKAMHDFDVPSSLTWVIGDSKRDILAGRNAGTNVCLVRTGNGTKTEKEWSEADRPVVFEDIKEACDFISENIEVKPSFDQKPLSRPTSTPLLMVKSAVFLFCWATSTIPYSFALLIASIARCSITTKYRLAQAWGRASLFLAKVICGITYKITNYQALQNHPILILANHQTAWETIALISILPSTAFVVKKELLAIPFFGYGLKAISPIAIKRSKKISSLEQLLEQGTQNIQNKRNIVLFPEGTRIPTTLTKKHQKGGGYLAKKNKSTYRAYCP